MLAEEESEAESSGLAELSGGAPAPELTDDHASSSSATTDDAAIDLQQDMQQHKEDVVQQDAPLVSTGTHQHRQKRKYSISLRSHADAADFLQQIELKFAEIESIYL